ncbi:hypothetical protein B5M09_012999 [Aphanomyces astaci]|uniref:CBM1 domain-containing protein n=1 Tax=Aphanomyces astaci TaxID=112090 RepID=A0A3R7W973_APHAT|nr:hypothetical protein B5M09_012999 [Aphanomyces astaci]
MVSMGRRGVACSVESSVHCRGVGASSRCWWPVHATCQKILSGVRGCVFGVVPPSPTTTASIPSTTTTTTALPKTTTSHAFTTTPTTKPTNSSNATASSTTIVTPSSPPVPLSCAKWSQCNGQNGSFGVGCNDPTFQYNRKNEYLSLCEPKQPKTNHAHTTTGSVAVWQQCGGKVYNGDSLCIVGNVCERISAWYSQCQLDGTADGLPTYVQCGGKTFQAKTKSTVCRKEGVCVKYNDHYSHEDGKEEEEGEEEGGDKGKYANKPPLEAGPYEKNRGTQRSQGRCAGKTNGDCCDWDDQCEFLGGDFYCMEVGLCETDYDTAFDCGIDTNCNPLGGKSKRYAQCVPEAIGDQYSEPPMHEDESK